MLRPVCEQAGCDPAQLMHSASVAQFGNTSDHGRSTQLTDATIGVIFG